jgi:hypothetical protein
MMLYAYVSLQPRKLGLLSETDLDDSSLLKIESRNVSNSGNMWFLSRKQNSTSIQLKVYGTHLIQSFEVSEEFVEYF